MSTALPSFAMRATSGDMDFELPPPGIHPAVLVGLIDLGTHESNFGGQIKDRHKILLVWELVNECDSQGQNFIASQDYTWSLNVKAGLRRVVEGFLGKSITDGSEFDLMTLLGAPCMVSLTEGQSGNGRRFIEVTSLSPPMRGLAIGPPTRELFAFHLGALSSSRDELKIPDWVPRLYGRVVAEDIKASKEFRSLPAF